MYNLNIEYVNYDRSCETDERSGFLRSDLYHVEKGIKIKLTNKANQ